MKRYGGKGFVFRRITKEEEGIFSTGKDEHIWLCLALQISLPN